MTYVLQQLLNALQVGSIYALIALGYTMVYGILTMINFAHGDLFMVGAFLLLRCRCIPSSPVCSRTSPFHDRRGVLGRGDRAVRL